METQTKVLLSSMIRAGIVWYALLWLLESLSILIK